MNEFLRLLVCWVMTFGLAFVAALTDGPFGICDRIRNWARTRFKQEWIHTGVGCPVCCSCWFGLVVSAMMALSWQGFLQGWFGAIGFCCVVTSLSPD